MKKLLALILMAALCLGLLAGCGEPAAPTPASLPPPMRVGKKTPAAAMPPLS